MNKKIKTLIKKNTELEKQLNKTNQNLITDIVCYLRISNISMINQETIHQDICLMLLEAERNNLTAQEVIGEDYQEFCDNIIASFPKTSYQLLTNISALFYCIAISTTLILIVNIISSIINHNSFYPTINLSITEIIPYITIIFISFALVKSICQNAFSQKHKYSFLIFTIALILINIIVSFLIKDINFDCHIFILIFIILISAIISKVIEYQIN